MRALASSIRGRMSDITAGTLRRLAVSRGRDPIVWLIVCGCVVVSAITVGTTMMVGWYTYTAGAVAYLCASVVTLWREQGDWRRTKIHDGEGPRT